MASISATGLGSGLDIEAIISGLMQIERQPLTALQKRQSSVDSKISAYGSLKSALSNFQKAMSPLKQISAFEVYKANSSDEDVLTVKADSNATPGKYTIDFSQADPTHQLAQAHKIASDPFTSATTSTGASGTLTISFDNDPDTPSFGVTIDGSNDTLQGIRDAINNASDNIGVTATIINVDAGSKLVLTSDETGEEHEIFINETGNVATTLNILDVAGAEIDAAQNAIFSIDGNTVTSQSNVIEDAIEGVTLTLKKKADTVGETQTITIENDVASVKESVQKFIEAYNTLKSEMKRLRTGDLKGDNAILTIENQVRGIFNTAPSGLNTSMQYLSEIGITTDAKTGDLLLDSGELESALESDFGSIAELLANDDQGYVYRLEDAVDQFLDLEGLIATREETLDSQKDSLEDRQLNLEYRLELIEKRYREQFTALDGLLAGLNSTSSYLQQQLANLPG